MILFIDTETTGKYNFRGTYKDPDQPRIVQVAGVLADEDGKKSSLFNFTIKPEGFEIPEDVTKIHAITQEMALKEGVDARMAMDVVYRFIGMANTLVAHNLEFDEAMLCRELMVQDGNAEILTEADDLKRFCTMHEMTDVCQLPGRDGQYKWPTLYEAYYHCFKKPIIGAHNALTDTVACAKIYFWLMKERKKQKQPELPVQPTTT